MNSREVVSFVLEEDWVVDVKDYFFVSNDIIVECVLGVYWCIEFDIF